MTAELNLGDLEALANEPEASGSMLPAISLPSLTEEEKRKLEAEARKEVEKKLKTKAMDEYKESIKKELERQARAVGNVADDGEELEDIRIELAKYTMYIMLDGKVYYHGYTYKFGAKQAAVIRDQIYRSWLHDAEIHGLDINEMNGRQKHMSVLSPGRR